MESAVNKKEKDCEFCKYKYDRSLHKECPQCGANKKVYFLKLSLIVIFNIIILYIIYELTS